jgi:uncharacterized membrane protein
MRAGEPAGVAPQLLDGDAASPADMRINSATGTASTLPRVSPLSKAVVLAAFLHALVIAVLAIRQHHQYGSWGFDFGLYDQVWWLLGQDGPSSASFITVRGMPVWGHHVNAVMLLLAPFARLGLPAEFLLVVQALAVASGAFPLAWLGRSRSGSSAVGGVCAAVYLLHPAVGWLGWVSFHPEALAISPLLFAAWFAYSRRYGRLAVCLLLALSCREEVGLVVGMLGLVWVVRALLSRRRLPSPNRSWSEVFVAGGTVVAGFGWFVLCSRLIIPAVLGSDAFYIDHFYARFGSSMSEVGVHLATHPGTMVSLATEPQARTYLLDLFVPLGGLPLLGGSVLAAAPQLVATIAADSKWVRDVRFQYTALMLPGLMLASVEVLSGVYRRRRTVGRVVMGWVLVCSVGAALVRGPLPGSVAANNWKRSEPAKVALDKAVALVPPDARVAAADNLVAHLSHRRGVYDFPNPFEWMIFGQSEADAARPTDAEWVLVQPNNLSEKHRAVLDRLVASGSFETVLDEDGVLLLRRDSQAG